MPRDFLNEDFLLENDISKELFHKYAENMPIFDYHCHLPTDQIATDNIFENITQIWLYGDHYKWRSMRTAGIPEKYCTGNASDEEKFMKWAETVPQTIRNPHYHWTHMELQRYFGINKLLCPDTAKDIYAECNKKINSKEYSVKNLLLKMNVKVLCTTDDPADNLEHHKKLKNDNFKVKVLPAFRPDSAMACENTKMYNDYLDNLSNSANQDINTYNDLLAAIDARHAYFHETGCRISDHGLETIYSEDYTLTDVESAFLKVRSGKDLNNIEVLKLKSALLYEFGKMNSKRGWAQQLHLGALRNTNTRLFSKLGPNTGFDTILDIDIAKPLAKFLDNLDKTNELAKTILYNLNPRDNELMSSMAGCFQDGSIPGKMQFGSAWWFLDQKDGIEKQINALSVIGLLSRFIGMLTDSRSFLSYPRHEYFRRILCNIIGRDVEKGELPDDMKLLGTTVENICFNNAENYFGIS